MKPENVKTDTTLPCGDKLAFATRKQAQAAATVDAYRHATNLKVYKCRHCPMWHLSSTA